ncbi:MAG: PilZ domain-containing protein [Bryobacteraceae bacterium]
MPTRILRRPDSTEDRRSSHRMPIERDVRYRVLAGKGVAQAGTGKTLNMSSGGVLFTTQEPLPHGERVELSVSWPAQLNQTLPLKLVAMGRLVRCEEGQAAIAIERYEFKTQGSNGL